MNCADYKNTKNERFKHENVSEQNINTTPSKSLFYRRDNNSKVAEASKWNVYSQFSDENEKQEAVNGKVTTGGIVVPYNDDEWNN